MSTHKVEVVPIKLLPHPNADTLSIVEVYGFTVCVRTADWVGKDRGAYIPPDSIVDTSRKEFAFLEGSPRVKVKKLRGVVSMGLLVPTDREIGTDVMEELGVTHYDPPETISTHGDVARAPKLHPEASDSPKLYVPVYDVENGRKYNRVFSEGEPVIITEKVHGANGRWVFDGVEMHAGSRTEWKKKGPIWWQVLENCPWLEEWCRKNPGKVVYGEVFGPVQNLRYGREKVDAVIFDILDNGRWLNYEESRKVGDGLIWVPTTTGTWKWPDIATHAEGQSALGPNIKEGCVVKPPIERLHRSLGRVQVKLISNAYLEKY